MVEIFSARSSACLRPPSLSLLLMKTSKCLRVIEHSDIPGKWILDAVQRVESSLYSAGVNLPCHNRRGQPYTISQLPRSGSHPHTPPQSRVLHLVNSDTWGEELRSKNLFKARSTTHNIHIFFPSPTFPLQLGHDHNCWSSSCSFFGL